jgi:selenocysteine lyase/cysteine desulfurase
MSELGRLGLQSEPTLHTVRALFPHLEKGIYLNTAAAGVSWKGQGAAAARFYDEHKSLGFAGQSAWRAEMERTQRLLADLLRVRAEQVSFVSSTTEALNLVAHAVRLERGDQVVLSADEFPSILLAWSAGALREAELVRVPIRREATRTEELIQGMTARTRLVCVSHVHWSTGTRVDLTQIAAAAGRVGARLIVDGAHAVGAIDVDASVADFYTGPVFKWLLSAFGLAYVVLREEFAAELEPTLRGYRNAPPSRELEIAHPNYPAMYALSATLEWLQGLSWHWMHHRVDSLTRLLHDELTQSGWDVVTPREHRAGIISIPDDNADQTADRLASQGVEITVRDGFLRVSPHFYNSEAEIYRFLQLLGRERA